MSRMNLMFIKLLTFHIDVCIRSGPQWISPRKCLNNFHLYPKLFLIRLKHDSIYLIGCYNKLPGKIEMNELD